MRKAIYISIIVVVILVVAVIYVGKHGSKLRFTPTQTGTNINSSDQNMSELQLQNLGKAPDFVGIDHWLNTPKPLSINDLKGKVVLVDFWTFSCINCIRTLPYVTKWYDTYHDQGFVVIGVHTPEFPFEKVTANVQDAINRYGIHYPVAQDNEYATWNNYNNQFWPAEYLIDQNGNIVYTHFGEGNYDHTENAIRELLGLKTGSSALANPDNLNEIGSPEMYFGTERLQYLSQGQTASTSPTDYSFPANLDLNTFALSGNWSFSSDHITLEKPGGAIKLKFHSAKVFLVAQSSKPVTLKIKVDGKDQPDVVVSGSKLYTLFSSTDYSDHTLEISIPDPGLQTFTFTFG